MKIRANGLLASSALIVLLAAGPAHAQLANTTTQADTTSIPKAPEVNEEIVVTAQKREQALIDIPQSVSVVSGETLERQQANTFSDYLKLVPGLQLSQSTPGEGRLIIRGLNTGGVASTVAVYVDETPFGSSSGLANGAVLAGDFDTFDVARIEVLRGPQGTLYGASSLGGVLRFVTNAPETDRFSARARGGIETVKGGELSYFTNAVINVPLGDTLALRASGLYRDTGGYIDSIGTAGSRLRKNVNASRVYGGRASLLFKPVDAVSLRLNAIVQNIQADASTVEESDPATLKTLYGRPTQSIFVSPFGDIKYRIYNGTADIDLGPATLTSSTSYSTQKQTRREDQTTALSGLIASVFETPNELYLRQTTGNKKFTQELRLAIKDNDLFDLIVGGYYTNERGLIFQQYVPVTPGTLTEITALPLLARVNLNSRYEEIAGFADATVHLGGSFDVDFGGRYSHNKQRAVQALEGALVGGASTFTQPSKENVFTYSVAPKFKIGDHVSLYARVAKGFRPGGPNALAPGAPAEARSYDSDSTINYEAGVKAETADRTFGVEIAAFHIDWKRVQLLTTIETPAGPFSFNGNGAEAKVDGVEFNATLRPTRGLEVALNGAYTDARLTQDAPAAAGLRGDKLPFSPRGSVSVNADYSWSMGGETEAFLGASLRFLSRQTGPFDPEYRATYGRLARIPSYEVVDLRAGLDFGRYGVQAYVRNLNNADGTLSVSPLGVYPAGAIGTGMIRPRSIGLALTAAY